MTQYKRRMRAVLCTALVAVVAVAAGAQTVTGSIRGLITDPSGAVVPGSEITATNVNTGVKTKTTTDKSGNYNIQTLSVGPIPSQRLAKDLRRPPLARLRSKSIRSQRSM
jgi:hypothetical protein